MGGNIRLLRECSEPRLRGGSYATADTSVRRRPCAQSSITEGHASRAGQTPTPSAIAVWGGGEAPRGDHLSPRRNLHIGESIDSGPDILLVL